MLRNVDVLGELHGKCKIIQKQARLEAGEFKIPIRVVHRLKISLDIITYASDNKNSRA